MLLKDWIKEYGSNVLTALSSNTKIDNYPKLKLLINTTDAPTLDYDYHARSDMKYITPLLLNLKYDTSLTTPALRMQVLTNLLIIKYAPKWEKQIDAITKEYNPINNYDMVEEENQNTDISVSTGSDNNNYAFNTTDADGVPVQKGNISQSTEGKFDDNHRKLTRSGNIGASAQLLDGEMNVRDKYIMLDIIYKDIDELLTLAYRRV